MNKIALLIAYYLLPAILLAQTDDAQKYAGTISPDDLKKHLSVIASAEMEGRETGTPGQRRAAAYIESQFNLLGLQKPQQLTTYQQIFPVYRDTMISTSLKIGKSNYEFGRDFLATTSVEQSRKVKANRIIFVGYGITDSNYNDYEGKDVAGKIVAFFTGEPRANDKYLVTGTESPSSWTFPGTSQKIALAKLNGAVAALIINPMMESIPHEFTEGAKKSNLYLETTSLQKQQINSAFVLPKIAGEIFGDNFFNNAFEKAKTKDPLNNLTSDVKIKITFDYEKQQLPDSASNVLGVIEGSDKKNEYVFLTAHYDHLGKKGDKIYYGADDDGSGTVSVIAMAEAFTKAKAEGKEPRRSIVFMTVSGEEKGLWGSKYYSDHPLFPLENTTVDLNTDMVGRIDTERKTDDSLNYIYVIGHDKLSSDLQAINEGVNSKYGNLKLDYKFDDPNDEERIYYRSDHYNFARKGVPILFFYDGMLKGDYHKPTDTIDKINWSLYEKRVQLIFLTAWEMANRDDMLKRDIPMPSSEDE